MKFHFTFISFLRDFQIHPHFSFLSKFTADVHFDVSKFTYNK